MSLQLATEVNICAVIFVGKAGCSGCMINEANNCTGYEIRG